MTKFKVSKNWDCTVSLEEMIEECKFCVHLKGPTRHRPRIVTKKDYDGINCFEISYDDDGLTVSAVSEFKEGRDYLVNDISRDAVAMIKAFLIKDGAEDYIIDQPKAFYLHSACG